MKTFEPTAVATWAKLVTEVAHCQVLLSVVLVVHWYSSDREPPGKRSAWLPIVVSRFVVVGVSKTPSQTAVLTPKRRASTVRMACEASTVMFTTAGGGSAVNETVST